jgi:hypothetical protein
MLADSAEATAGLPRAEVSSARDAFASADAYLAWNAERPGDILDLVAPLPESDYVRLWVHRLAFPAGAVFALRLVGADEPPIQPPLVQTPDDFLARVLGQARAPASVDCHSVWPHRQAYRFDMPPMANPAPGGMGRIRFTCLGKQRESRGYLLALDQIGVDPAPATPDGWYEIEYAAISAARGGITARRMSYGREDFFGWGGREIAAAEPSSVQLALDLAATGAVPDRVELRGIVESGEWSVGVEGQAPVAIAPSEGAREASVWQLTMADTRPAPVALRVQVQCHSKQSRVLLDAWHPLTGESETAPASRQ